jgi:hypothetical protein
MVISLRRWIRWGKFLVLLLLGTWLLYQLLSWLIPWFHFDPWEQVPNNGAVKVFATHSVAQQGDLFAHVKERLQLFYQVSE